MSSSFSRRRFIAGLGAIAGARVLAADSRALNFDRATLDLLSDFASLQKTTAPAPITFGYASITWGGNDLQAINDVSELGFKGIQLRSNIVPEYASKPKALRDILAQNKIEMVALSSGGVQLTPGKETEEIEKHARHGAFVRDVGGRYLQVTDGFARRKSEPTPDDYKRLGRLMTEIGKRTTD
ncbi:MAG TPA: hypothetical protein VM866_04970, partial [Pyrinomonadaceae bacterium]|nr:hypothetical protein [Pyrinomonadaceae bacterium]